MMDKLAKPLFILMLTFWAAAFVEMRFGLLEAAHQYSSWTKNFAASLLFFITILTLVILETKRGALCERMSFLGDISYSTYLIHFPLQLFFFAITSMLGVGASFYRSTAALVLFFSVLLTLCFLSHRCFERPVQKLIRTRFIQTDAHTS